MTRFQVPRGLRTRLTLWIAAILVLTVSASFLFVYRGTGRDLRSQLDNDLKAQAGAFAAALPSGNDEPGELGAITRRYVTHQPFRSTSQLLFARLPGDRLVTNEPELLGLPAIDTEHESSSAQRAEDEAARILRTASPGFTTVDAADLGGLRVYVKPVYRGGRQVALVGVGEPLGPVTRAQHGVAKTFLLAGLFALAAAALAGYLVASRVTRPLRRMARTAAAVNAGDLSHRIGPTEASDEIRVLAESFDRMLDRLDDAFARQREFVSDASHELRTPLTILRGQLEVLARQPDVSREEVARVTRLVTAETERMERLVDDLLLLAKTEEGGAPLSRRRVELRDYVNDVFDALSLTADRHFELGTVSDVAIEADPDRLSQVIHNLAQNAVAHTGPGGLVRLSAAANGRYVRFAVEDDGPGIPPEERDRIFDRFHRTDHSRARATGGSGLGLAIARALVQAHGGKIRAGQSPEGGARVEFDLPR